MSEDNVKPKTRPSQVKASKKWCDANRDKVNAKSRERYELIKKDKDAYERRKQQMLDVQTPRQRELNRQAKEIRMMMRITV